MTNISEEEKLVKKGVLWNEEFGRLKKETGTTGRAWDTQRNYASKKGGGDKVSSKS